jgi:hypothetical protein
MRNSNQFPRNFGSNQLSESNNDLSVLERSQRFENSKISEQNNNNNLEERKSRQIHTRRVQSLGIPSSRKRRPFKKFSSSSTMNFYRQGTMREVKELEGKSLCLFGPEVKLRQKLSQIVESNKFDGIILLFIFISSILLILENPLTDPEGTLLTVVGKLDIFVSCVFTLECMMKVYVYGFICNGKNSYIRNPWNIIDFIIVVFSMISIVFTNVDLSIFKVLRLLRVLRPLRVISRNEGLKVERCRVC